MGAQEDPRRRYVRRITLERPGEEAVILVTDLLDEAAYPVDDLLLAYLIRWQIENVFQEITEVFELRRLIGSTPQATVFQASLCLVIYNALQVLRGYAAQAGPTTPADEPMPAGQAKAVASAAKVEGLSSEKIFADLHEELTGLHRVLSVAELLPCLPVSLTAPQARQRLGQLLRRAWSPLWKKAKNKKPRPAKPQAKQLGAHTSVHKLLLQPQDPRTSPQDS